MILFGLLTIVLISDAQPHAMWACCYGKGVLTYGFCNDPTDKIPGIRSALELYNCWDLAIIHFSNNTRDDNNQTIASYHNFFMLVFDNIKHMSGKKLGMLKFDSDIMVPGVIPVMGYLPFAIHFSFPFDNSHVFEFSDFDIEITLHHLQWPEDDITPLLISFDGSGRDVTKIRNLQFKSFGYGQPVFSRIDIHISQITSIWRSGSKSAGDTFNLIESNIRDSNVFYYGDVTGDLGQAYGDLSQRGSTSNNTIFKVTDPTEIFQNFSLHGSVPPVFRWVGNEFPDGFLHINSSSIEIIGDIQLGTVNVLNSSFYPWTSPRNPVLTNKKSTSVPPTFEVYQAEGSLPPTKNWGSMLKNCSIKYIWSAFLSQSAFSNCLFQWENNLPMIPDYFLTSEEKSAFIMQLQQSNPQNAFNYTILKSKICLRKKGEIAGVSFPDQQTTIGSDTVIDSSTDIAFEGSALCEG